MKLIFSILVVILLAGCCAKRPLTSTVSTFDSTSVERKVVIRDTIVKLPFYKIGVSVLQEDLSDVPVTRQNGNARIELSRSGDTIHAKAFCDSLELQLQLKDSIISTFRDRRKDTVTVMPPEQIKYVPWPVKALAWIGGIFLLYLGVRILIKIYKPKFL